MLWEHINYTGRCYVLDRMSSEAIDVRSLVGSVVGDEEVSSISFGWSHGCSNPMTFASLSAANGVFDELHVDVADLTGTATGNDAAVLVQAIGGPMAVYSDANFEGTCATIQPGGMRGLSNTPVGARRASSIAIGHRCVDDLRLCEHDELGGGCISLTSSKPRLSATDLGNDAASSLRVPDGWKVTLYEHDDYKGRYDKLPHPLWLTVKGYGSNGGWGNITTNIPLPAGTDLYFPGVVGNDELSSIKVEAPSSCQTKIDPRCVGLLPGL